MKSRHYAMGLPVVVTVDDAGHVGIWLDTSEIGVAIHKGEYAASTAGEPYPNEVEVMDSNAADADHAARVDATGGRAWLRPVTEELVMLIDDNDNTIVIACDDAGIAERVGQAAIFTSGDVSAYVVPTLALQRPGRVIKALKRGASVYDLYQQFGDDTQRWHPFR